MDDPKFTKPIAAKNTINTEPRSNFVFFNASVPTGLPHFDSGENQGFPEALRMDASQTDHDFAVHSSISCSVSRKIRIE